MKEPSELSKRLLQESQRNGTTALYVADNGLKFRIRILEVASQYGHITYRVTPTDGTGEVWLRTIEDDTIDDSIPF